MRFAVPSEHPVIPCGPLSVCRPNWRPPLRLRSGAVVPGLSCCCRRQGPREGGKGATNPACAWYRTDSLLRRVVPCSAYARLLPAHAYPLTPTRSRLPANAYPPSRFRRPTTLGDRACLRWLCRVCRVCSLVLSQIAPASEVGLSSSVSLNVPIVPALPATVNTAYFLWPSPASAVCSSPTPPAPYPSARDTLCNSLARPRRRRSRPSSPLTAKVHPKRALSLDAIATLKPLYVTYDIISAGGDPARGEMSHTTSTPSIQITNPYGPNSHRHRSLHQPSSALPMAIPNAAREDPPPPLPPPRYISGLGSGQDPGWKWSNRRRRVDLETMTFNPDRYNDCSRDGGDTFERSSQMSLSAPTEADMASSDVLDHSDEERNGLTRPSLAR